ncbi:MAG TPA: ABC transporter permease [Gammaproteobacteria bacterium]
MDTIFRNVRHAFRVLRRAPGFSLTAVATLALGLGAATAMFTIVNSVLLRPLPFKDPDRVAAVYTRYDPESGYNFPQFSLSGPEFLDYRAQTRVLEDVAAYNRAGVTFAVDDPGTEPTRGFQVQATANLFSTLGVEAAMGRTFRAGDDAPGAPCTVVLGHGVWLDAFGGDRSAVGRNVRLNGEPCEVIGIMAAGFTFPDSSARWWRNTNVDPASLLWNQRRSHIWSAVGRLAPGATFAQADAEALTLAANWAQTDDHHKGHYVFTRAFTDDIVGAIRPQLAMLLGAVGLVLLVICANLASLLLARGEGRRRELAVRLALGAGRARLVGHLLIESALLALAGGVLGVTAAFAFLEGLLSLYPGTLPRAEAIALDWRALAFAMAITGVTALLFGLLPALRASSSSPETALHAQTRGVKGSGSRLMRAFVVAEVALSVMLVVGAGLLLRSYENVRSVDLGFDPEGVYTVAQSLPPQPGSPYSDPASVRNFYAQLLEQIAALPGVEQAGAISALPLQGAYGGLNDFIIEGRPEPAQGELSWNAGEALATAGYFETMRIPLIEGRTFEAGDTRESPYVAVINEEAVRLYWPNESPLGKRIRYRGLPGSPERWITIVGVVGNTLANGATGPQRPQIYTVHAQMPRDFGGWYMAIVVRAAGDPLSIAAAVNGTVRAADPALPPINAQLMADVVGTSVGQPRFTSQLAAFFAIVALLLGALGIHGVLSYVVAQRVGELGVRLALGARPATLLKLVVGQGMWLACVGVAIGIIAALAGTRVLRGLLFGVGPSDPAIFAISIAVLGGAAFLACYGPARRAARIDPMTALRAE